MRDKGQKYKDKDGEKSNIKKKGMQEQTNKIVIDNFKVFIGRIERQTQKKDLESVRGREKREKVEREMKEKGKQVKTRTRSKN